MNKLVSRGLYCALLVGGFTLLGTTAAQAADTSGDDGLLSGTQIDAVAAAPVTLTGNALSVLGDSVSAAAPAPSAVPAAPAPAAPAAQAPTASASTSGTDSIGGGTQAVPVVTAPVVVGGNAVSVIGDSTTTGSSTGDGTGGTGRTGGTGGTTSGDDGIAGGTQVITDVLAPVTTGGNAISVIGDSTTTGSSTTTGNSTGNGGSTGDGTGGTGRTGGTGGTTSGDDGIAGGTQVITDVLAPVTVGGNAVSVIGDSTTTGSSGSTGSGSTGTGTGGTGGTGGTTSGDDGIAGGTQVITDVLAPITAGGNAVSVIGDSTTTGPTDGGVDPTDPGTTPTDPTDTPVTPTDPTDAPDTPTVPADTPVTSTQDGSTPPTVPAAATIGSSGAVYGASGADRSDASLAFTGAGPTGSAAALALGLGLVGGLLLLLRRRTARIG